MQLVCLTSIAAMLYNFRIGHSKPNTITELYKHYMRQRQTEKGIFWQAADTFQFTSITIFVVVFLSILHGVTKIQGVEYILNE